MRKDPLLWLLLLAILLVLYATLYPFRFQPVPYALLHWESARTNGMWMDIVMNIYFFLPIGLLAGIRFRSQTGMLISFLGCVLLTLSVETAQAFIPGRFSSLRDVALNSLGGFLGLLLAHLPIFDRELLGKRLEAMLSRRGEAVLLGAYAVMLFFPFLPMLRLARVREFIYQADWSHWYDASTIEAILLAIFASQLFQREARFGRILVPLLLLLASPFRILLWGRSIALPEVIGPMIGATIAIVISLVRSIRIPDSAYGATALAVLLWRQLQPFQWGPFTGMHFNWIPIRAAFEIAREDAIEILCLKTFLYWYTARQLSIGFGIELWRCTVALAVFLLVSEFGQMHQVGRTPEITDPLLVLVALIPLLGLDPKQDQGLKRVDK